MEFIRQIEQLFHFCELNLSDSDLVLIEDLKIRYNNDFNLFGSFVKDYLTLRNNYIVCKNEDVYKNFVEYFMKSKETIGLDTFVFDFCKCAKYYLVLIFEKKFEFKTLDNEIMGYIETINLFFAMELYPYLLNKIDKFLNLKIDRNIFSSMLKSLVDIVVDRNIKSIDEKFDLAILDYEVSQNMLNKKRIVRGLVG